MESRHSHLIGRFALLTVAFGVILIFLRASSRVSDAEALNALLLFGVLLVTTWYAVSTFEMTRELREQRLTQVQPVVIQKAINTTEVQYESLRNSHFSHFVVFNSGTATAIELEISLLDAQRTPLHSHRDTFLKANEQTEFVTDLGSKKPGKYYLLCEYKHITSMKGDQVWSQTWLPFETIEASAPAKVYVKAGELEFKLGVPARERVDAFSSVRKPH